MKEARRTLGSGFTWICDAIDNPIKHALGNAPNSEFVVDGRGRLVRKRAWSDAAALRADLEELVGKVENPTDPVADGIDVIRAEFEYAVTHEGALKVEDILDRRTRIGLVEDDFARAEAAAEEMLDRAS